MLAPTARWILLEAMDSNPACNPAEQYFVDFLNHHKADLSRREKSLDVLPPKASKAHPDGRDSGSTASAKPRSESQNPSKTTNTGPNKSDILPKLDPANAEGRTKFEQGWWNMQSQLLPISIDRCLDELNFKPKTDKASYKARKKFKQDMRDHVEVGNNGRVLKISASKDFDRMVEQFVETYGRNYWSMYPNLREHLKTRDPNIGFVWKIEYERSEAKEPDTRHAYSPLVIKEQANALRSADS